MHLREYLKDEGLTVKYFARKVGMSVGSMYQITAGNRLPDDDQAIRFVAASGGKFSLRDQKAYHAAKVS